MDWNGRIIVLGPPDVLNPDSIVISDLFEKHPIPDSTKQSGFVSSLRRLHSIFQASPSTNFKVFDIRYGLVMPLRQSPRLDLVSTTKMMMMATIVVDLAISASRDLRVRRQIKSEF